MTYTNSAKGKKMIFPGIVQITKELIENSGIMLRVAEIEYRLETRDSYLGRLWNILTPLIQIGVYWLVFGLGLRRGRDVDGVPFLLWMLAGLVPWFFISACLTRGADSIYSKLTSISKLPYPLATAPVGSVITEGIRFLFELGIVEVIYLFHGYYPNWYYLNLIYYIFYMFCFLSAFSMVSSVFTMIARDFSKLLKSCIRLFFYITPILWDMSSMPQVYQRIVKVLPFYYIINGFRESMLYRKNFFEDPVFMLVEWGITALLYVYGCHLQLKFKNRFRDLI